MMRLFTANPVLMTADTNTDPWSSLQQGLWVKSNSKGEDVMDPFMY